jgi:nicotinamide-nucleotide amidase
LKLAYLPSPEKFVLFGEQARNYWKIEEYVVSLNLIINDIIVGYEEETIEFLWGYVKKKVKPFYSRELHGGKIAAVLTSIPALLSISSIVSYATEAKIAV